MFVEYICLTLKFVVFLLVLYVYDKPGCCLMEEQSPDTAGGGGGGGGGLCVKDEEVENERLTEMAAPDPEEEEEDDEALPHSEILDIFEEGLARLVQDPLLCDLPIQVCTL